VYEKQHKGSLNLQQPNSNVWCRINESNNPEVPIANARAEFVTRAALGIGDPKFVLEAQIGAI
jgi:hypothetical protein